MEKSENNLFSKTTAAFDLKVGNYTELNNLMNYMNIKGQGHYLTFLKGHSIFKLKFCFSQKLLGYLKPNIM